MVGQSRKPLVASRRRVDDDGEEESGPDAPELDDDSLSEASALTDMEDEDADAEGSDISEQVREVAKSAQIKRPATNGRVYSVPSEGKRRQAGHSRDQEEAVALNNRTDTDAMMNGLQMADDPPSTEEVQFEDMAEDVGHFLEPEPEADAPAEVKKPELPHERRRREQEEYRKKRDADPTFVPNRGGFFMHDHRHAGPAANGFRPFGRGRGRGRGVVGGQFVPANQPVLSTEPADSPWSHDLHETIAQHQPRPTHHAAPMIGVGGGHTARQLPFTPKSAPPNRSFSKSTHIGNVQIRVYLAEMTAPITFSAVPVKQHTRLPQHRPPLRRDKPVRVSIPNAPPRYIFPSMDRSFIFIPRAFRPNQQGYGRIGGCGNFSPSYRGVGSRRTSAYGSSLYSPSVAMSRRSSLAKEVARDSIVSPNGSTISRPSGISGEATRPVVRLPPSAEPPRQPPQGPALMQPGVMSDPGVPAAVTPLERAYPPPQNPTYRENRSAPIPMHQPRPQKAVSVADIESPEKVTFPPPQQQQQQPFHQQVPPQVNGHPYPQDPSYNPHARNASYPSQPSAGTPLSQIPERAIHAQPFQPQPYQSPQQGFYPSPYQSLPPQGGYYLSPPDPRGQPYNAPLTSASAAAAPVFVPSPQPSQYVVPVAGQPVAQQPAGQGSTVAQESNGMVYYYDSTQLYNGSGYPPSGYALPPSGGVVGIGGMMTPSPDGYYFPQGGQAPVYYPQ
ncbi:MAG: hypothetical protein M1837_005326 [Sclerophora amabilis]|nr:MAG: hypothetical protein M1837_005326 [Sclerophora amabilis]